MDGGNDGDSAVAAPIVHSVVPMARTAKPHLPIIIRTVLDSARGGQEKFRFGTLREWGGYEAIRAGFAVDWPRKR